MQAAKNLTALPSAAFNAISPELASAVIVKNLIGSNDTHAASVVIAGYLQANEEVITSAQFNTMTAEIKRVNSSVALWLLRKAVHFDAAEACLETPSPSKRKSKGANSGGQTSHKRQRAESTPSSSSFSSSSSASPPDPDVSAQPASTLRERCITSLGDDFRAVFQPNPQARSSMPGDIPFEARIAILERALQLAYTEVDSTKKKLASWPPLRLSCNSKFKRGAKNSRHPCASPSTASGGGGGVAAAAKPMDAESQGTHFSKATRRAKFMAKNFRSHVT